MQHVKQMRTSCIHKTFQNNSQMMLNFGKEYQPTKITLIPKFDNTTLVTCILMCTQRHTYSSLLTDTLSLTDCEEEQLLPMVRRGRQTTAKKDTHGQGDSECLPSRALAGRRRKRSGWTQAPMPVLRGTGLTCGLLDRRRHHFLNTCRTRVSSSSKWLGS